MLGVSTGEGAKNKKTKKNADALQPRALDGDPEGPAPDAYEFASVPLTMKAYTNRADAPIKVGE